MSESEITYTNEELEAIKENVLSALEQVIDPELGIDIVNLGLIYEVLLEKNGYCQINMTLTTMGCPLADVIHDEVHRALKTVSEVKEVNIKLVWYPAWSTERMSRYARIALGIR
ncbi:metal-sulfur cluster assembly factor [Jeotgalibaca porci]|uniref:Metal-sulfur cluster assembly factor n=1 Tax=Jeotgalibaca porci TaxID=1868793 RepID=A0A6G7WJQ4_9LACT|nr:metal-sulfur cluster assembly factor [Jeotgalibaca porci]NLB98434.1 metal-sulfur cluster assembly factor [Lactobacillales bacterium]QIK52472.1 metal-sulfur cluster assembly factor [Jeotgalibaca porci]